MTKRLREVKVTKDMKNTIRIDYANNPDLVSIFVGKEPGDTVSFVVTMQLTRRTDEFAEGDVTEVEIEESGNESEQAQEESEQPENEGQTNRKTAKQSYEKPFAMAVLEKIGGNRA